jgi:hypothetical protein
MKQKDIILVGVVAFISAIISIIICNQIFSSSSNRQQQVEVVQPITSSFAQPDKRYFNEKSIDPTKLITIGQNVNPDPFSGNPQ